MKPQPEPHKFFYPWVGESVAAPLQCFGMSVKNVKKIVYEFYIIDDAC
jgi:hypothetical protein